MRIIDKVVVELDAFCCETRNVHKNVKYWTRVLKRQLEDDLEESGCLRNACCDSRDEMSWLRGVAIGHAEVSLHLMEGSFALAYTRASSLAGQVATEAGPTDPGPQPVSRCKTGSF